MEGMLLWSTCLFAGCVLLEFLPGEEIAFFNVFCICLVCIVFPLLSVCILLNVGRYFFWTIFWSIIFIVKLE